MVEPITHKFVDVQDEAPDAAVQLRTTPEGVAMVLLNRPAQGNAIGAAEVQALTEAFTTLQGAEGVRVIFLRGAQGCFTIGSGPALMRAMIEMPEEDARVHSLDVGHMLQALHAIPALTVALVDGPAVGVGVGLVAACDMAVASRAALFALPGARLGLSPGSLAPFVAEAIGPRAARRLFAYGHRIDAEEAYRIGLVDQVVEDDAALNAAQDQLAEEARIAAPSAVEAAKRLIDHVARRPIDRAVLEDAARRYAAQAVSPDAREGLAAFLEERDPSWKA